MEIADKNVETISIYKVTDKLPIIKEAEYIILNKKDLTDLYQMNSEKIEITIGNLLAFLSMANN